MESVRHSEANGFTATSSPPSLIMHKSIHRVLMAPAMHDTDLFKWPRKKEESFTHLQSWQKTIRQRYIESAFSISRWCKCLLIILMCPVVALMWFSFIFDSDDYIQCTILYSHTWTPFILQKAALLANAGENCRDRTNESFYVSAGEHSLSSAYKADFRFTLWKKQQK